LVFRFVAGCSARQVGSWGLSRRLRGSCGSGGAAGVAIVMVAAVKAKAAKTATEEAEKTAHGEYLQSCMTGVTLAVRIIKVNIKVAYLVM
jgi:hypothetical protein